MDTISYVLAMEEISKVDASTSVCMSVNNSLVCYGLQESYYLTKRSCFSAVVAIIAKLFDISISNFLTKSQVMAHLKFFEPLQRLSIFSPLWSGLMHFKTIFQPFESRSERHNFPEVIASSTMKSSFACLATSNSNDQIWFLRLDYFVCSL